MSLLVLKSVLTKLNHPQTNILETQKGQEGLGRSPSLRFPSNPGYQHTGDLMNENPKRKRSRGSNTVLLEWV